MRSHLLWICLVASPLLPACGSDCPKDSELDLVLVASPTQTPANGLDHITLTASVFGFDCKSLPEGALVTFVPAESQPGNPAPADAYFSNGERSMTVPLAGGTATTSIYSQVAGLVSVEATVQTSKRILTAEPVDLEFTPPSCCHRCDIMLEAEPHELPSYQNHTAALLTAHPIAEGGVPPPAGTEILFETNLGVFTACGQDRCYVATEGITAQAFLQIDEPCTEPVVVHAIFTCDWNEATSRKDLGCAN